MAKRQILATLALLLLVLTAFAVGNSEAATNVIRNGNFDSGLNEWVLNPLLTATDSWPLQGNPVKANLHPPTGSFVGTIISQNLNVTNIGGVTFTLSINLTKNYSPAGKAIAVYLSYIDNADSLQRVKVLNPDNSTITTDTLVTGTYTFTEGKLIKIEIAKEDNGEFLVKNVVLSADGITVGSPPATPVITSLSPTSGTYGSQLVISGTDFGAAQGSGSVLIGGSSAGITITNWSSTSITVTVQDPAMSGAVWVVQDYVVSNTDKTFDVTSPNFVMVSMSDPQTVIKGQTAEFLFRVDFNSGFNAATGINFATDNAAVNAVATITPVPMKSQGGVMLRVNTAALNDGTYQGNLQSVLNGYATRSAPFALKVVTVNEIKFYETSYDAGTQQTIKTYLTQKNITKQGQIGGIYTEVLDTSGNIISMPSITYSSTSGVLGVYPTGFLGYYEYYAADSGAANLVAVTPDGRSGQLTFNIAIPASPRVTGALLLPQGITNKYVDTIAFSASGTDPLGYGTAGNIIITGDTRDWVPGSGSKQVAGTFKVDHSKTELGQYLFYAFTCAYSGGYCTESARQVAPLSITNDPSYSAIKGASMSIDAKLQSFQTESFVVEFYQGANLILSKPVFSMHTFGAYGFGAIPSGTYKIRITPSPNSAVATFIPQWYPNAVDAAGAQEVVFAAGQTVENIFFFLKAQPTFGISGTVTKFTGQTGLPLAGATVTLGGTSSSTTTTDSSGNYSFSGLPPGNYTVTPSMQDYHFIPAGRSVTIANSDMSGQNFTGSDYSLTGVVKILGTSLGIEGAIVSVQELPATGRISTATTDSSGNFVVIVPSAGNYVLFASKQGYANFYPDSPYVLDPAHKTMSVEINMAPPQPAGDTLFLHTGWNFVSFAKQPPDGDLAVTLADVLQKIRVIWGYNNQSKQWLKWKPSDATSSLTSLATDKGYWIFVDSAGTVNMSSWTAPATTSVYLYAGWNLIGYCGTDGTVPTTALNTIEGKWAITWGWDAGLWSALFATPTNVPVPNLTAFQKGLAYWLRIRQGQETNWTQ